MKGLYHYCSSFEVIHEAEEKIEIALIEAFPCKGRKELEAREAELIMETDCVNRQSTGEYWKDEKTPLQELIYDLTADYRKYKAEYDAKRRADPAVREKENKQAREKIRQLRADPTYRAEENKRKQERRRRLRKEAKAT